MTIKVVLHRFLVKPFKLEEVDKDIARARALGIQLIDSENKREQAAVDKGVVVDIGPTAFKDFGTESPIKVGDVVAFAKYGGKTIKDPDDDVEYVVLNDEDLVAILTKKEPTNG